MLKFFDEKKGQGALEYILIIGAAVLIAAIVIAILVSAGNSGRDDANKAIDTVSKKMDDLTDLVDGN
ncbi:MAG: class III signal peptide-containing protein [Candidatus Diapherotrites archaeon CG09_land_8_20_14_0_10_32_12]|nr:MAG: class III signal peptide-containing protein [Candidatus Diapherotrites archaeon CG09_land_8_20_14_0_10_32_12]